MSSAFASASRAFRFVMVAFATGLVAGGVACDELSERPGADFRVELLGPSHIQALGAIQAPVRFRVIGCKAFEVVLDAGWSVHPIASEPEGDGVHRVDVPVAWVWGDADSLLCREFSSVEPIETSAELEVTCLDARRTAKVDVTFAYLTATRSESLPTRGSARLLVPSGDPLAPFWFQDLKETRRTRIGRIEPHGASSSGALYFTSGCPSWTCPVITVSEGTVQAERLTAVGDPAGTPEGWWDPAWVPRDVVDLVFRPSGELVVLSQDFTVPGGRLFLTTVWPTNFSMTSVRAEFPREVAAGGLVLTGDGTVSFLAYRVPEGEGALTSVLHTYSGFSVSTTPDATGHVALGKAYDGEVLFPNQAFLAPDGSAVAVLEANQAAHVGAPDGGDWVRIPFMPSGNGVAAGVAWGDEAFVVWEGAYVGELGLGQLTAFDRSPPHALRFHQTMDRLPFEGGPLPQLHGVLVIGDRVVLSLSTGVRVLDLDGNIVGGAEPWPCHLATATPAVQTGPSHFAIAAGENVYVFDLSHP